MAKAPTLVTQYLENISRDALEEYQDIIRHYVRNRQGIYALYRGDKLYYVGLASNLRMRLKHHLRDRHRDSWNRFSVYLTIGDSHLRELEALVLRIVPVPGNKQKGKFSRSEDLRRMFGRDIRAEMRGEYDELLGKTKIGPKPKKLVSIAKKAEGRQAVLSQYFSKPTKIRGRFKGQTVHASVRKDGLINLSGKTFTSPSLAAAHACNRRTCNGWKFWQYERSPGDWVLLDELRK